MTSFGDLNFLQQDFLWHLESHFQILLVYFLAHEFVWPAVAIISVFLLLLDIQTLLLMCNLDSSLTDLMNETLGLGLQNRLPRFLGIIFFGRSQSCKQISSPINGKKFELVLHLILQEMDVFSRQFDQIFYELRLHQKTQPVFSR